MGEVLLEVAVRHPRDVAGASEGGADRLLLTGARADSPAPGRGAVEPQGDDAADPSLLSPDPAEVSAVCRESDLPVFVLLRLSPTWSANADELDRLAGLAQDFLSCGATGVDLGFLDGDLEVDVDACLRLTETLPGVPWTFHRAIDATLDPRRSWRRVLGLPDLVGVRSAGSARGLAEGYDDLLAAVSADPEVAGLALPGGGLQAEQVPWLVRAGVRQLHLGPQVRPGATYRSDVDAGHVRSWRLLVDSLGARV